MTTLVQRLGLLLFAATAGAVLTVWCDLENNHEDLDAFWKEWRACWRNCPMPW